MSQRVLSRGERILMLSLNKELRRKMNEPTTVKNHSPIIKQKLNLQHENIVRKSTNLKKQGCRRKLTDVFKNDAKLANFSAQNNQVTFVLKKSVVLTCELKSVKDDVPIMLREDAVLVSKQSIGSNDMSLVFQNDNILVDDAVPVDMDNILPVTFQNDYVSDAVTVNKAVIVNCRASLVFETNDVQTVVTNETLVTMTSDDETIIHPPSESSTPTKKNKDKGSTPNQRS